MEQFAASLGAGFVAGCKQRIWWSELVGQSEDSRSEELTLGWELNEPEARFVLV